jgi:trk system potassium uptake protein
VKLADRRRGGLRPARITRVRSAVMHLTGLALFVGALGMLLSGAVGWADDPSQALKLVWSAVLVGVPGFALWRTSTPPDRIPSASMFAAVFTSFVALSLAAALPYVLTGVLRSFDRALFEAVAGLTTTAATVLRPVEGIPRAVLFWRALTQWVGGAGVVVFAVSVLPYLGTGAVLPVTIGGTGPDATRLAPRVRETARRLVALYVGFTLVVGLLYAIFGMTPFDAVAHALTTVSTGGFSTRNASFAAFGSAPLEWVAIVAMVGAGSSFALLWQALRGKPLVLWRSVEFRAYLGMMAGLGGAAVAWNAVDDGLTHDLVRRTLFSTVSVASTTGYSLVDFDTWRSALQLLLVFAMGLGAMRGSTSGGFKVFRLLAVLSYARRQLFLQLHPRAVAIVRFGSEVVPEAQMARVVGFFGLFMAIGGLGTLLIAAFGADVRTAIAAAATSLGNVGPGLGALAPGHDYLDVSAGARWTAAALMLVGRLEVFPVLLGVVPFLRFVGRRLPMRAAQRLMRLGSG